MRIFIAVIPEDANNPPFYFSLFCKEFDLLYPAYDWTNSSIKTDTPIPSPTGNIWLDYINYDLHSIRVSDLIIYDLDRPPGDDYLMAAHLLGKKIWAMSESLRGVSPRMSALVQGVFRPFDLYNKLVEDKPLIKRPIVPTPEPRSGKVIP